jgi:F0F1-type ATP synthase assembly protein I
MQLRRPPQEGRIAFQAIFSENGCAAPLFVLLATGVGLLLDFQVTHLHPVFSVGLVLLSVPVGLFWTVHRILVSMDRKQNPDYVRNLALAAVAGQAGCSTVVLVFLGLFGGLYLDSKLNTHPIFTVALVLLSIPVGLYAMVRTVLSTTARITLPPTGGTAPSPRAGSGYARSSSAAEPSHTKENGP